MYITYTSSQKTRHQKLNSHWAMNSLGDKICPPAAPPTPAKNRMNTHARTTNTQAPHEVKNQRAKAKRTSQIM